MIQSKKGGFDTFTVLLTVFAILALGTILAGVIVRYNDLTSTRDLAGTGAAQVLSAYEKGDGVLLYVDYAAKIGLQEAAYNWGRNGFYAGTSSCGSDAGSVLWSAGSVSAGAGECSVALNSCIPSSPQSGFNPLLLSEMNSHAFAYNEERSESVFYDNVVIPDNNYDFGVSDLGEETEVIGYARAPVAIDLRDVHYEVLPSFRENLDLDIKGDFQEITSKIRDFIGSETEKLDSAAITDAISDYNSEGGNFVWNVAFSGSCSNQCSLGESCMQGRRECEDVEKKTCPEDPETGEESCETEVVRECHTVYDIPGNLAHLYCSRTAEIKVNIVDEAYRSNGNPEAYAGFVSESGFVPYEYRFGLNWLELQDVQCCTGSSCSTDFI